MQVRDTDRMHREARTSARCSVFRQEEHVLDGLSCCSVPPFVQTVLIEVKSRSAPQANLSKGVGGCSFYGLTGEHDLTLEEGIQHACRCLVTLAGDQQHDGGHEAPHALHLDVPCGEGP